MLIMYSNTVLMIWGYEYTSMSIWIPVVVNNDDYQQQILRTYQKDFFIIYYSLFILFVFISFILYN